MKTKRKLMIVGATLVGIFLLVNIVWFATVYRQWHKYEINSGVTKDDSGVETRYYGSGDDKYSMVISKPRYLRFTGGGFLSVSFSEPYSVKNVNTDNPVANREVNITMYFWPNIKGEFKNGVIIQNAIESEMYHIYLDKDLKQISDENLIDEEYTEVINKYVEENKETIEEMYQFGIDSFGLDKDKHILGEYQ